MYKRDTCMPMLVAATVIIAKMWNQPRCPTTDEQIRENVGYIHHRELNITGLWSCAI
jgi:hypothetical protein